MRTKLPVSVKPDRLSALLRGLAPRVEMPPRMPEGRGAATLHFAASAEPMLHLHVLSSGSVQLQTPDMGPGAVLLASGPAFLICRADHAHAVTPMDGTTHDSLVSARAFLEGPVAPLLLAGFVQPRVVPLAEEESLLQHVLALLRSELSEPRCGQPALLNRAGDIIFIGLLRHLIAHPVGHGGLLEGLADPRIARALVAIHDAPQNDWTLESLAQHAGMSRTAFAVRFRDTMDSPPGKYLSTLRLHIAQRAVHSGQGLKAAASASGYANVSALSRALSRARDT
ncbi:AraC family transcriptional regulator [Polaromonas sp.]|uniref:AraC family transcriptional regulator n=1 Tax=Polaromonas sp. TaxID=1869339 RepID=UPI002486EF0B|nr:AraC family transcriptional regulator [Polaromonas sp.]MDI1273597.1 AraC family transcriptional regulator [Polaromonas sp.]